MKPRTTKPRKPSKKNLGQISFRTTSTKEHTWLVASVKAENDDSDICLFASTQPRYARKLAAWLLKSADYLESKE